MLHNPASTAAHRIDQALDAAVLLGVTVLVLVGFATSYHTLRSLAITTGGYPTWLAPAVPLSFDLGIVVLSLKIAQAAREGRPALVLRALVTTLSAATVAANASAVPELAGRLLHAVPPAMFVICFETVIVTIRRHALQARGSWPQPLPRQPPLRWILAPHRTLTDWRRTILDNPLPQPSTSTPAHATQCACHCGDEAPDARQTFVLDTLRADRQTTAQTLRDHLADHGAVVSLRTAQRLKAVALDQLSNGTASTS